MIHDFFHQNHGIERILQIQSASQDIYVKEEARECLALLGHVPSVKGQGLRLLSIDGGGIR